MEESDSDVERPEFGAHAPRNWGFRLRDQRVSRRGPYEDVERYKAGHAYSLWVRPLGRPWELAGRGMTEFEATEAFVKHPALAVDVLIFPSHCGDPNLHRAAAR